MGDHFMQRQTVTSPQRETHLFCCQVMRVAEEEKTWEIQSAGVLGISFFFSPAAGRRVQNILCFPWCMFPTQDPGKGGSAEVVLNEISDGHPSAASYAGNGPLQGAVGESHRSDSPATGLQIQRGPQTNDAPAWLDLAPAESKAEMNVHKNA